MTITYNVHRGIRYTEVPCSECRQGDYLVSAPALELFAMDAPFQTYVCPTCRKQRDPDAALYAEAPRQKAEA